MRIVVPYLKKYWGDLLGAISAVIIYALTALWQPRLLQKVLQAVMANKQELIRLYGVQLIGLAIIGIIAGIANVYFAARLAQGVTSDLREEVYIKIQSFSFSNIEYFSSGSLVVRLINDMNQITNLILAAVMQIIRVPVLFIGSFILGMLTIPRLWWVEVLLVILILGVAYLIFKRMGHLFEKVQKLMDKITTLVKEELQGIRLIKSFNQEKNEEANFNKVSDKMNDVNLIIGYLFSVAFPIFMGAAYLAISLAIYVVGQNITVHPSDITAISSYVTYLYILTSAIIVGALTSMQVSRGIVSLGRIKEVLDTKPSLIYKKDAPQEELVGSVEFDNVSFRYPGASENDWTLKDISLQVKPGEMVGIVGATGAGKSTMAQLIARLYDPVKGSVKVGGIDLRDINEKSLRAAVSFVLQQAVLFTGTIESNLKQNKREATIEELERAIGIAQAAEFINTYSDRFEHVVEERSANFSGGQKQRLSIARGVVGNPTILILDDSTSALDANSEKLVQEALAKHLKHTTTFIIAEKIVSVLKADKILVLDEGRLVAQGTHKQLLQSSPIYQKIYATQKAKKLD
ncbi:ABC transporter ATP-binding protein/permease [Ligilactobacillus sp. WILCCON 0076]|uniref:ABC transporter ATP-binding protein/permease n=1 Tax=Ligilactobacillus ubinensis TaxID=2876789 RepID=A0A9X2JM15_9LACO|nr:ABC transporter ATP-binding protein [Ligilactobacillus ubinensis]MCP0887444.1 ABC transporter ATP-binding protein/permease [Ligilactobacillus ubinensis]